MGVLELLGKRIVFFDGAMGTILQQNGLGAGELPELWNLERQDLIEQIFEVVIADGKGIELNTSSRAYKLKSLMPSKEILKLYHDMGGKIITIGSDAHNADRIGDCVMESQKILKDIGFDGIYTFEKMKPEFHRF